MNQKHAPTSDWRIVESHENWQVKQRDILVPSTENVQVCKICGKEFLNFIVDHVRREHGINDALEEYTDGEDQLAKIESEGTVD